MQHEIEMTFSGVPGGSVVRPQCFHCRGLSSVPGQGTKLSHMPHDIAKKKKEEILKHRILLKYMLLRWLFSGSYLTEGCVPSK